MAYVPQAQQRRQLVSNQNAIRHGLTPMDRREQESRALRMRSAGSDLAEIATALDVSLVTASRRVHAALDRVQTSDAEQHRALESSRLDSVLLRLETILNDEGSSPRDVIAACKTVISTSDSRARLLGLNAATKVELTPGPMSTGALEDIERALELR